MTRELIDKEYVSVKVPKKIGAIGIKRVKDYIRFLEINKEAPKKVAKKKILQLADEITATAWKKFKKQHNLQ